MSDEITRIQKLQIQVTKTILLSSGFLILMILFNDLQLELYSIALLKIPVLIILSLAYLKLKRSGFKERYTHFVNIPMLFFFILNYIGNQGTNGPTFYGVLTLFVVYPILLGDRWKWVYTILTISVMAVLLYWGVNENNLTNPEYKDRFVQFEDHLFTFVSVAIFLVILITLVLDFYKKQNRELVQTGEILKKQIQMIESEKQKKETLLRILAHDVKNPVNNLGQLIELYQDDSIEREELKKIMDGMKSRIVDLKSTIENVLSNADSGLNLEGIEKKDWDHVLDFTEQVLADIGYKFSNKNQRLLIDSSGLTETSLRIRKHLNEIAIILKNLLDNASKYSPNGSEIKLSLVGNSKQFQWEIEDQGSGIDANIRDQLFQRKIESKNGSGVGLFLCKSIADSIGAEIRYISKNQGSIFQLFINDSLHS